MVLIQASNSSALWAKTTRATKKRITILRMEMNTLVTGPEGRTLRACQNLREDFFHDLAVDDRRALRPAMVQERDLPVIETQLIQDGRVQIVGIDCLSDRFHTEFVGLAMGVAGLHAAAGQPLRVAP